MSDLIKDHEMIGKEIYWDREGKPRITGTVVAVKYGDFMLDMETGEELGRGIKFKIKPKDGRALWTGTFPNREAKG